jgi:prophage regulatory protein
MNLQFLDSQLPEPFLSIKKVQQITGKSRSTIYRWIRDGLFPQSVSIGPNSIAWSTAAVNEWVNGKLETVNLEQVAD